LEVFALGKTKGNSKLLRQEIIQMISLFYSWWYYARVVRGREGVVENRERL
jgi:hypothetical protein